MQYKNKFGTIQVMEDKKFFRQKTIGLSMSGGADSTMLCYLLAITSHEHNLEITIQPYNGYDVWAPLDSAGVINIIQNLRKRIPGVDIQWPISTVFDTNGASAPNDKNSYIGPLREKLIDKKVIDLIISGISMGPPMEVQQTFSAYHGIDKQIQRLPGYRLWNEVEEAEANTSPFKYIDKRFILQCYKDFRMKDIFERTNSCTDPLGNCRICWWCQERKWAMEQVWKK